MKNVCSSCVKSYIWTVAVNLKRTTQVVALMKFDLVAYDLSCCEFSTDLTSKCDVVVQSTGVYL